MIDEEEPETKIRQVGLTALNESVMLSSTDPKEDMKFLSELAIDLFYKIRRGNGK